MAITISGENNNDRITAQDGVIDTISGFNIAGIITASSFTGDLTGDVTGDLTGNVTGNVNNTSNLLLQVGGTEKLRLNSDRVIIGQSLSNNQPSYNTSTTFVTTHTNNVGAWNAIAIISGSSSGASFVKFGDKDNEAVSQIGHYNADNSLRFLTNGTNERLRITSTGELLHSSTGGNNKFTIKRTDAASSNNDIFFELRSRNTADQEVGSFLFQRESAADDTYFVLKTRNTGGSNTERLRIKSDGNVGIGTNNPTAKLDVVGGIKADGTIRLDNTASPTFYLTSTSTTGDSRIFFGDPDSDLVGRLSYVHNGDYYTFYAAYGERFRIAGNGDITVTSIDSNATGPTLKLFHNSGSPAANDVVSRISMFGDDSAGNETEYGRIETKVDDVTDGQETAHINFATRGLGSYANVFRIKRRSTGSAPSYTADDADGVILDVYNTGNPYPRYMNFIAKSAGNTDSNIGFWTEAVGGSPTEKLRIDSDGRLSVGRNLSSYVASSMSSAANDFIITAAAGSNGGMSIVNSGANDIGNIFFANGTGENAIGRIQYEHQNNAMVFQANNGERLRITSAGSMGLGTGANIDERVHFENAGNITLLVECSTSGGGSNSAIRLKSADSSSDWYMQTGNAVGGGLRFYSGSERVRITSGGDVGVNGGSDVERKVDIVTSDGNSVLIRPNTGGDNSRGNANVVNNSLIFRMPYGENAGSSANAGARIGIVFTGRNDGSGYIDNPSKSASIYGISEDVSAGYSRLMGMGFFTSPFDAAQTEKMRISAEGYVTTPSQPAFAARLGSGNITITSNTGSDMVFNTEEFDNHNDYDTSNGRFTAPVAGKYYFGVQLYAGFDGAGVRVMHANFRVNGTSVAQADMFGGASNHGGTHYHPTAVGHMFRNLNANDYVTFNLGGFSHTGGQAILYASTGNRFFGYLVG